jgi:hypothetical protein
MRLGGLVVAKEKSPKSSKPKVGAIHELPLLWVSMAIDSEELSRSV